MTAYYNEINPYAAQWLRNLISAGHIAPGDVDERSIEDVTPADLAGYTQCHFFAGIGVWSLALRRAGWPDDEPAWTGSCPCQPFSAAGKGGGFDDERHLWPAFFHLVGERRPSVILGEQVASKDGLAWFDLVQADLEGARYASAAVDLCAAGVGAPHIRQRLWWVGERLADADCRQRIRFADGERRIADGEAARRFEGYGQLAAGSFGGRMDDDDDDARLEGQRSGHRAETGHGQEPFRPASEASQSGGLADDVRAGRAEGRPFAGNRPFTSGGGGRLADADGGNAGPERQQRSGQQRQQQQEDGRSVQAGRPGPTNGFWRDADWLFCRDGRWRPVEPGTFPLVNGASARVGRLRAYGNAIVAQAAEAFIRAYIDSRVERLRLGAPAMSDPYVDEGVFG